MFYEGRQIGGYTLLRKLGKGGFGEVWLAEKRSQFVTKKVAVKLPLDEQVNLDAIRQEAELWEQASGHPNVLPIIDADIIDSQVVIVSEYAEGGSLADRIRRDGKLPLQTAVEMTVGILSGLEFLHRRKIIHRDIKPQNILLQGDTPRLADFGISRAMNTTVISSAIIGTDAYMSPEAFDGKRTVQTDIWSVGVVLYALLADRLPFPQEHPSERMFAILTKDFTPLPPEIPPQLQRIVDKALAKQPENRYQTTGEMRAELQKVLIGIAHPTFAPTEVFQIRPENLPTIPTLENSHETGEPEKETLVNAKNIELPPTVPAVNQESIVTNFRENPPVTNEPAGDLTRETTPTRAAQFQTSDKPLPKAAQTTDNSTFHAKEKIKEFKFVVALLGGLIVVLIISFIYGKKGAVAPSNPTNAASRPASFSFPLKIELSARRGVSLTVYVDGSNQFYYAPESMNQKFTAYTSFGMQYRSGDRDDIQLKINGFDTALPKASDESSYNTTFEINISNIREILQPGLNSNQLAVNTGVASNTASNTTSSANAANAALNLPPTEKMNIIIKTVGETVMFRTEVDRKSDSFALASGESRTFVAGESFRLSYYKSLAGTVRLSINGESITLPAEPANATLKTVNIEIKKDNLAQILQNGKVSAVE